MGQITVTPGEGRTFPMHHTIATAPGGTLQLLLVARVGIADRCRQPDLHLRLHPESGRCDPSCTGTRHRFATWAAGVKKVRM
jgi:hypothetical protein